MLRTLHGEFVQSRTVNDYIKEDCKTCLIQLLYNPLGVVVTTTTTTTWCSGQVVEDYTILLV